MVIHLKNKGMNQRITIQKRTVTKSTEGLEVETWDTHYSCWAYVNNLSGSEWWTAYTNNAHRTVNFSVKHCQKISQVNEETYRIIFKNEIYNIIFVDNVRYENDMVTIKGVKQ